MDAALLPLSAANISSSDCSNPNTVSKPRDSLELLDMPMLTKKKRLSGHGFFSSSPPVISSPTSFVKLSGMGHDPLSTRDSAADDRTQDKRAAEPLVEDLDQIYADEEHAPVQQFQPWLGKTPDYSSPQRHRSPSPSKEDAAAAPPPDFTRRGIHIPMRTR